jgi:hypothetical protein
MECLNIDSIGPLQADELGNKFILVVICCFTRFLELYAVPDVSALPAARALLQHVGRYGAPARIRSDQGSQFVNETITELTRLIGSEHCPTTAYSKEENAIVERANKEVMRHLRAIIFDTRVKAYWSMDQLPLVQRILNAEEKKTLGASPAELLFGNAVNLNRGIFLPHIAKLDPTKQLSPYMGNMLKRQAELIKVAQETQLAHDEYHMSQYEGGFTEFPINSYVLLDHPSGPRSKLSMTKSGPFRVVNIVGSAYTIQDLLTSKNMTVHISTLTPFNYDADRTDPVEVAMHDKEEFVIDSILSHRGDKSRRNTMEFKVRWTGYDPSHDSWEPYSALRDTGQLHDYLRANRMKSLINKKFH